MGIAELLEVLRVAFGPWLWVGLAVLVLAAGGLLLLNALGG